MGLCKDLDDLSRIQLYSVIRQLEEETDSSKNSLIIYKLLSNTYRKYVEVLNEINETIVLNEEVLHLEKEIKLFNSLNKKKCFVYLEKLSDNQFSKTYDQTVDQNKDISEEIPEENPKEMPVKMEIKIEDIKVEDPEEEPLMAAGKECTTHMPIHREAIGGERDDIIIQLNDISEIGLNSELNVTKTQINKTSDSSEGTPNQLIVKNKSKSTDKAKGVSNECQIIDCKQNDSNCIKSEDYVIDVFDSESNLVLHKNRHTLKSLCNIDGCQYGTYNNWDLVKHKQKRHQNISEEQTEPQLFSCEWNGCRNIYPSRKRLSMHTNKHLEKYKCNVDGCAYNGGKSSHLIRHMKKIHLNDTSVASIRRFGKNGIQSENSATNQIENKPKEFRCDFNGCSKAYPSRAGLRAHKNKHLGRFVCDVDGCDFRAGSSSDLTDHFQRRHLKDGSFVCPLQHCDKRFNTRSDWRNHQRKVHKITQYISNLDIILLDKQTKVNQNIENNENQTSEAFKCLINGCDQQFSCDEKLRQHMLEVHKLTDTLVNVCEEDSIDCDNSCNSDNLLNNSVKDRTNSDYALPFTQLKCLLNSCDRKFNREGKLRKHMIQHMNNFHKFTHNSDNNCEKYAINCNDNCNSINQLKSEENDKSMAVHEVIQLEEKSEIKDSKVNCLQTKGLPPESQTNGHKIIENKANETHGLTKRTNDVPNEGVVKRLRKPIETVRYFSHPIDCENQTQSTSGGHTEKDDNPIYKCQWKGCTYICYEEGIFELHKNRHEGVHGCQFADCSFRSNSTLKLREHISIHMKGHKCLRCDENFLTEELLRKHRMAVHYSPSFIRISQ